MNKWLSQIALQMFDIRADPFHGYGFSILTVDYSITRKKGVTSSKGKAVLCINYRKQNYAPGFYDKTLWVSVFGIGKRFMIEKRRPTRPDGIPYDIWYFEAQNVLKELSDISYSENSATKHYVEGLSPRDAAERYEYEY
jgi:hypothetical protein